MRVGLGVILCAGGIRGWIAWVGLGVGLCGWDKGLDSLLGLLGSSVCLKFCQPDPDGPDGCVMIVMDVLVIRNPTLVSSEL